MKANAKHFYLPIALLVGIVFSAAYWFGIFSGPENFFIDLLFSNKQIDNKLVILAVDDESLSKIGQWPWPRQVFADTINKLNSSAPRVLAFDVLFAESSRYGSADDTALALALASSSFPIVMTSEANSVYISKDDLPIADYFSETLSIFSSTPRVSLGHANMILDKDSVIRKFPLQVRARESGKVYNSLAYETVLQSGEDVPNVASLDLVNRIVYAAPAGSVRTVPFWRVYSEDDANLLKDKIVFLGVTAADLHDTALVPFDRGASMPGVEIQANTANMLLQGYRLNTVPKPYIIFWIMFAALLPALFFGLFKRLRYAVVTSALAVVAQIFAVIILFQNGFIANIIHLTLAGIFSVIGLFAWRYFVGEKEKHRLHNIFSLYVSKEVVKKIMDDPSKVRLGGEEKTLTVFFSDIRGFTTLSEGTTPIKLVEILNRYFSAMTEEVLSHKGVLDKYIGDAIMAFWGAPINDAEHAEHAMSAAVTMLKKLKKLNEEFAKENLAPINIGIGLYSGPAVVGNMGSELRLNYTAMGDTVNVASRLEGLNKEFKTQIIVGESTKNLIKTAYNWRSLGSVQVKGRNEPVSIYTVDL
ncbi:MAG: adenylate/guanylate cyclase domain-containing protein [Patescibacteria group bacterium]